MSRALKHRLPAFAVIDHLSVDSGIIDNLRNVINELEDEFISVLEANKQLCGIHHELSKSVYDNMFQISLTESEFNESSTLEECDSTGAQLNEGSKADSLRRRKLAASNAVSPLNERTFTNKTEVYNRFSDVFDTVIKKFKGKVTRIRLVKLAAGTSITPHIDYDPSYAVRVIVPIISSTDCVNIFWVKNDIVSTTLVPGNSYFLNTGYRHAVVNMSTTDRYTLMISVDGTTDINHLITDTL